jgi:hypothetical protein
MADEYRASWSIPALKLAFNASRGYHLSAPAANAISLDSLPTDSRIIQAVKAKNSVAFTTEDLAAMNE